MIALIPARNDAYCLALCLKSLTPYMQVIVVDDASDDETPDVIRAFGATSLRTEYPMGWIVTRSLLARIADGQEDKDWLWLDSDDVFSSGNMASLERIVARGKSTCLRLCELWGDLDHTTQRLHTTDTCHFYFNRREGPIVWKPGSIQNATHNVRLRACSGPSLFFHLKGVKDDLRLAERSLFRPWLKAGWPLDLRKWARGRTYRGRRIDLDDPEFVHWMAMQRLFRAKQDHIKDTYLQEVPWRTPPERPKLLLQANQRPRFRVCQGDRITDGEVTWRDVL